MRELETGEIAISPVGSDGTPQQFMRLLYHGLARGLRAVRCPGLIDGCRMVYIIESKPLGVLDAMVVSGSVPTSCFPCRCGRYIAFLPSNILLAAEANGV